MFEKVLVAEDMDFINSGVEAVLKELTISNVDHVQYCDEALLKLKKANMDGSPYDLLISDLSFVPDGRTQKLKSGEALIEATREEFPNLKIVAFSIEDKAYRIQKLCNEFGINAYVWKSREGARELKQAIQQIKNVDAFYISPKLKGLLQSKNAVEITSYDIFIIECLSRGLMQEEISLQLKSKNLKPASVSGVEKRLKFLKEHFNANNPAHLISIAKDLGLI